MLVIPSDVKKNMESTVESAPPKISAEFTSLKDTLPSRFWFYPFNDINIRPFTVADLKKYYRAYSTVDMREVVRTIDNTIDQSAFLLTQGDFNFIMYWQRINSYKKSPYEKDWECSANPKHLNNTIIDATNLKIEMPEEGIVDFIQSVIEEYGIYLYPVTMRDSVEIDSLNDKLNEAEDETEREKLMDLIWDYGYAAMLNPAYHGTTLEERAEFFRQKSESWGGDFVFTIGKFRELSKHGVVETFTGTCKECGAETTVVLDLSLINFFPAVR